MVLALTLGANAQLQPRLEGDSSQAVSVDDLGRAGRHVRLWNRGPLTWSDFKVLPSDSVHTSWLECSFRLDSMDNIGGMKMCRTKVVCEVDPLASWVMDDYMTDQELAYNQVLFNLAEIQCRMFQPSLDLNQSPLEGDSLLMCVAGYYGIEEDRFAWESDGGQDSAAVARWLDSTNRVLAEMPAQDQVRFAEAGSWWMGAHLGMAFTHPGGGLVNTFRVATDFEFGFELGVKRSTFMWDFAIGGGGTNRSYTLDGYTFGSGKPYTWMQMWLGYGYYALREPKFSLMPFVGIGISTISSSIGMGDDALTFSDECGSWVAGLCFDMALMNHVSCPWGNGVREQDEVDVRFMMWAARSALCGYKSVSYNLGVVLNFSVRDVITKYSTKK